MNQGTFGNIILSQIYASSIPLIIRWIKQLPPYSTDHPPIDITMEEWKDWEILKSVDDIIDKHLRILDVLIEYQEHWTADNYLKVQMPQYVRRANVILSYPTQLIQREMENRTESVTSLAEYVDIIKNVLRGLRRLFREYSSHLQLVRQVDEENIIYEGM